MIKYILALVVTLLLFSCKDGYKIEAFDFPGNFDEVADSIYQFDTIVDNAFTDKKHKNISLGNRRIVEDEEIFGKSDSNAVINTEIFSVLSVNEKEKLSGLLSYLARTKLLTHIKMQKEKYAFIII